MAGHRFASAHRSERVRGVMQRALEKHGLHRRLPRRLAPETWAEAVGAQLAARAQPTVINAGVLHLLVEDHRWRDQLDAARNFILERLNARLGANAVRELRFGLAHRGALDAARTRAEPAPERADVEPARILGAARLEPSLREAVLRAAEAAATRRPCAFPARSKR